jgi:hypothetical protein
VLKKFLVSLAVMAASVSASANIITGSAVLNMGPSAVANPIAHPINISWKFSTIGSTNTVATVDAFSLAIGSDVFSVANTSVFYIGTSGQLQLVDIRGSGTSISLFSAQIYSGGPGSGVELLYQTPQTGTQTLRSIGPATETITQTSVPVPSSIALALVGLVSLLGASSKSKRIPSASIYPARL